MRSEPAFVESFHANVLNSALSGPAVRLFFLFLRLLIVLLFLIEHSALPVQTASAIPAVASDSSVALRIELIPMPSAPAPLSTWTATSS